MDHSEHLLLWYQKSISGVGLGLGLGLDPPPLPLCHRAPCTKCAGPPAHEAGKPRVRVRVRVCPPPQLCHRETLTRCAAPPAHKAGKPRVRVRVTT